MNYPCLKCIVEYLEANKRFRLSSKCPAIRKIERSIPLHLDKLEITTTTMDINDYCYKARRQTVSKAEHYLEGDIVLENQKNGVDEGYCYQLCLGEKNDHTYIDRNDEVLKTFPEGVQFHHAMKWLGNFLFGGRTEITTRKLVIVHVEVLRLPVDFKIKVTESLETRMDYLDKISEFVNPMVGTFIFSSYSRQPIRDHPLIQTAKKVLIQPADVLTIADLLNIRHKNIELQKALPGEFSEKLIRKWIADRREIGTSFTFNSEEYERPVVASFIL